MEDYGDWIWDESEYNFFMSLNDVDKLEYVFDFFNFSEEDYDVDMFDFVPETIQEDIKHNVDIVITDTHLIISCKNNSAIDTTIMMFKMDGMILTLQEVRDESRIYKLLGTSPGISLN